jgi:cytochrome P450
MNLLLFLLAGYDTTSNALSYCTYLLSLNPNVQQKLRDEVDQVWAANVRIKSNLFFLNMFTPGCVDI